MPVCLKLGVSKTRTKRSAMKKEKEVVVYKNEAFYSAFPCVAKLANNELLVIFRRQLSKLII